jgi:hypothetical protein
MMSSGRGWFVAAAMLAVAAALANPHASAATVSTPVSVKWSTQAIVRIALTPNYASGFGQIPAVIGTQPAPTHGPGATGVGAGSVDFGSVLAGKNYLYKYATHLNVTSSDTNGVNVYGEGAAMFTNQTDSSTYAVSSSMFFLTSTSGTADNNTGFSPSVPFQQTSGAVTGGGSPASPPTIAYTVYPAPISTSSVPDSDFYYDYQMHVPGAATSGNYFIWIVYTVVGK